MSGIFARAGCVVAAVVAVGLLASGEAVPQAIKPPQTLPETGLYADFAALRVDPSHLAFAPQYPLWTDGATKRRWISLPSGTAIDASDPGAGTQETKACLVNVVRAGRGKRRSEAPRGRT